MASLCRWARVFCYAATAAFVFEACSGGAGGDAAPSPPSGGGGGRAGQPNAGASVIGVAATGPTGGESGAGNLNPLCGIITCNPDDRLGCLEFQTLQEALPEGGSAGSGVDFGQGGAGGASFEGGAAGEAGAGGAAGFWVGEGGAAGEGGGPSFDVGIDGGSGGSAPRPPLLACQVVGSATECVPSGTGQLGAPCFESAACGAGFACIQEGAIGRCRPYCCQGEASCDALSGSYCAERPLRQDPERTDAQLVPVCIDADRCNLGEPPCDQEGACECSPGTACQVVRSDGTTSCVPPGAGTEGEACPCAYGFICSQSDARCRPLCRTNASEVATGCGRCQASAGLPEGWGVCIGN